MQSEESTYFQLLKDDFKKEMEGKIKRLEESDELLVPLLKLQERYFAFRFYMPSHGLAHGVNTAFNLQGLMDKYGIKPNKDYREAVIGAAILHDVVRPYEVHENNGIVPNGRESSRVAYRLAEKVYGEEKAKMIEKMVRHHDNPGEMKSRDDLSYMTALLRAADVLDVDVVRVLACAYEYEEVSGKAFGPEEMMKRWRRKVDFDLNSLREADLDGRIMKKVEEHYADVTDKLEAIIRLEEIGEGGAVRAAMGDCAIVERAKEVALLEVVRSL